MRFGHNELTRNELTTDRRRHQPTDGRRRRSLRTRNALIEAYLQLARERGHIPTALEVAERGGLSLRSVFQRFDGLAELGLSAFDHVLHQPVEAPPLAILQADRPTRIAFHAAMRAKTCETWLPLWRVAMQVKCSEGLRLHIGEVRRLTRERLELIYRPELHALAESRRTAALIALEALTDFECWGRMRDEHGMSFEQARDTWIEAIAQLLPPAVTH
jgi:AcrR family transcriptional regulator